MFPALASELSLNVCVLSLASPNVTDEKIGNLVASVPRRSVILIEGIDAFFQHRGKADTGVKLSYSDSSTRSMASPPTKGRSSS